MQSWEKLPLKVGNVVHLAIGQSLDHKMDIICGEYARATWFWLDIIIILQFGMPVIDVGHSGPVYVEFFGNGIIAHPSVFEMDDAGLLDR